MRKLYTTSIVLLFFALSINAQTAGTLTVTTTTSNAGGGYAPKNCVAIWIEDANGNFVKTLLSYAATRKTHLNTWEAKTTSAGSVYNVTDAITGATQTTHATRTCTWNGTNVSGAVVADGDYKVWMELTDKNATGNFTSFTFTKGPNAVNLTPANAPSFSNNSIVWAPAVAPSAPVISNVVATPTNPKSTQTVLVSATITDNVSVSSATLKWGTASGALGNTITMTSLGSTFSATIPVNADGTTVYYQITAVDGDANSTNSTEASYKVSDANYITFADYDNVDLTFTGFDGGTFAEIVNPVPGGINTSGFVGESKRTGVIQTWAGIISAPLSSKIDFSSMTEFKVKVYSPVTGRFLLKLEDGANAAINTEVETSITKINEWEELSLNFSGKASNTYNKIVLFFDFGTTTPNTFYFDDLKLAVPGTVGITETSTQESIVVFPNPATQNMLYVSTNNFDCEELVLINMNGQVEQRISVTKDMVSKINTSNLNSGLYVIQARSKNSMISKKVFIK